jgi:integrase
MAKVRKSRGAWVADFRDQNGKRHIETPKGTFETKALQKLAANELLQKRLSEVESHTFTANRQRMTFDQLAQAWIRSKVRICDTTQSDYQIMLDCFLIPYFGPRKAESLTRLDLERFRSEMSDGLPEVCRQARETKLKGLQAENPKARVKPLKNPGGRTINKCLGVMVSILRYAKKIRALSENVAEGIEKLPTLQGEERCIERNVLAPPELRRTMECAAVPYRVPIAIATYTGLREEEILGLKWGDFSIDLSTAEIRRTYRRGRFSKTKTGASRRTIEIPVELRAELRAWQPACPKNEHDLVCPSVTGRPMQASALLQRGFVPALARAGVRRVRFHDLRHSFASNLLAAGMDIVTVSKALGHANVQITLVTYAHSVPKPRQGASDRMAALLHQDGNKMETTEGDQRHRELPKAA